MFPGTEVVVTLSLMCVVCRCITIFARIRQRRDNNGYWGVYQCTQCKRTSHLEPEDHYDPV